MELRVWVDGIQRVVSGVTLTTTCHEIVFALAHATQQTGRFTMVERWRHNERLLSPNEQLLVTLQRWGDRMQEVEFILRRSSASTNLHLPQNPSTLQPVTGGEVPTNQHQQLVSFSNRASPTSTTSSTTIDKYFYRAPLDNQQHRSQKVPLQMSNTNGGIVGNHSLGTSENATLNNIHQPNHGNVNPDSAAISLPNQISNIYGASSNDSDSANFFMGAVGNGYEQRHVDSAVSNTTINNHQEVTQTSQLMNPTPPDDDDHVPKNYPYEDLYSTVCKKKNNPPPAVPAKPRIATIMPSTSAGQLRQYTPGPPQMGLMRQNFYVPVGGTHRFVFDLHAQQSHIMAQDLLQVIESQKKLLLEQRDELNKMGNLPTRNVEQNGLILKIEGEIQQLEKLWAENESQIQSLSSQDYDFELKNLKLDRVRLETELDQQKNRLQKCEADIVECQQRILSLLAD